MVVGVIQWPVTMTADERARARKLVRDVVKSKGNQAVFEIVHTLSLRKLEDRLGTVAVSAALDEMASEGIAHCHIDPRGVERWRVK